ncbi:MAG: CDP-alcohol phosphatidyltransferase family protein [Candidatus Omnitrophica bacterium]|nr:CDP-alcohol phosphatidyltransferase family protein [Candidatus Omnitrophota bacterium]
MRIIIYDYKIDSQSSLFIKLNNKYIISHLLEFAEGIISRQVVFCCEQSQEIEQFIEKSNFRNKADIKVVNCVDVKPADIILKANWIYDKRYLRKLIKRKNTDISLAVVWKIEKQSDVKRAEEFLSREDWNPIGRYINVKLGKIIARALAKKQLVPNQITILSFVFSILAALFFATNKYPLLILAAVFVQVHFTLDVADGHLARLKNSTSEFGSWLDSIVGRITDILWYTGICWGLYLKYNHSGFLLLGIFVVLGNFMISYIAYLKKTYLGMEAEIVHSEGAEHPSSRRNAAKAIYWFLEQWDVRAYIITLFAILNRLEIALIYFALDYNVRWIYNCIKVISLRYFSRKQID